MAVSFVAASTAVIGTTSVAPNHPAGVQAGDGLFVIVTTKPNTATIATPGGWALVMQGAGGANVTTGADVGMTQIAVFFLEAGGAWTGNATTVTVTSGNSSMSTEVVFRKGGTQTWSHAGTTGSDITSGTAFSAVGAANINLNANDMVLACACLASDTIRFNAISVTATGATIGALTEYIDAGSTTGNDVAIMAAAGSVTAGASSAAPTLIGTLSGNSYGVGGIVRVRASGGGTAAKVGTLTDSFATEDAVKWTGWTASFASVVSGVLRLDAGTQYRQIASAAVYDLTASAAYVELVTKPNVDNGSTEAIFTITAPAGDIEFIWGGTNIITRWGGIANDVSTAYNATDHRWLKISEAAGTVSWHMSADGINWGTALRTAVPGFDLTECTFRLRAGNYSAAVTPGFAEFDNFNVAPSTAARVRPSTVINPAMIRSSTW